jgi:hypothetical protein
MIRRKDLRDLQNLPRSPVLSYLQKQVQPKSRRANFLHANQSRYPIIWAFTRRRMWNFAWEYVRNRIGPRHRFECYANSVPYDNGLYQLEGENGEVRIALAGDWGTGTDEAAQVGQQIAHFAPHYTVHLGDIYYVGDEAEVGQNFLGQTNPDNDYPPCCWPLGSHGAFALNGNHEMYARGIAYFERMLPRLGLISGGRAQGQKASYFCLENDYWRVIGLDTGYNSIGLPGVEYFWPPDCALPRRLLAWIRDVVQPNRDKRGIILLSHHQYYSRFDDWYTKPARQLAYFISRPVLWFWGHEHRMAIYKAFRVKNGLTAIGRCAGHGGMPVDLPTAKPKHPECPLEFIDCRAYASDEGLRVGMNGFVQLTLQNNTLRVEYADLTGDVVFSELWKIQNGTLVQLNASRIDYPSSTKLWI